MAEEDQNQNLFVRPPRGPFGRSRIENIRIKHSVLSNDYQNITFPGSVNVDMLYCENDLSSSKLLMSACWDFVKAAHTPLQAAASYATMLSVFIPKLKNSLVHALIEHDADVNVIRFPDDEGAAIYNITPSRMYSYSETVILMGINLLLPFKQVNSQNYVNYINARIKAISGRISATDDNRAQRLNYPLNLEQAQMIRTVFGGSRELKRDIIEYIMWASTSRGIVAEMARYLNSILAYSEMNIVMFMEETFVKSGSPVLRHRAVQNETNILARVLHHMSRYKWPQYFKYFCTPDQETLLMRNNFPNLGAAALTIIGSQTDAQSIKNYVGTTGQSNKLVEELVMMHKRHCDQTIRPLISLMSIHVLGAKRKERHT